MNFKDSRGRPLTQGLFLEIGYNTEFAEYTLKDDDFEYEGKLYPSLKKLYIKMADPIEYNFATTHLGSWEQWQRISNNKILKKYIDPWRKELELKLRSEAVAEVIKFSKTDKGFQAAKWLADKGFDKRAGRPSKEEIEAEKRFQSHMRDDFDDVIVRLENYE